MKLWRRWFKPKPEAKSRLPCTLCVVIVDKRGKRSISRVETEVLIEGAQGTVAVNLKHIYKGFLKRRIKQ